MKKHFMFGLIAGAALLTSGVAAESQGNIGIVNFATCITDSKFGKQEQASFEALKKQLSTLLEDTEKQLTEISAKFNDQEFMDGLSPEGEEELKTKFQHLNEELNRYQQQYYQVLNQANMRIIQILSNSISTAAEKVAKEKNLGMVVNKDACFFYTPKYDITTLVVSEMDKTFEQEAKKQAQAPAATAQAPAPVPAAAPAPAATAQAPAPAATPVPATNVKAETKTK